MGSFLVVGDLYYPIQEQNVVPRREVRELVYQDYQFWHTQAKQAEAAGDYDRAYWWRRRATAQWIASGHKHDKGHDRWEQYLCQLAHPTAKPKPKPKPKPKRTSPWSDVGHNRLKHERLWRLINNVNMWVGGEKFHP